MSGRACLMDLATGLPLGDACLPSGLPFLPAFWAALSLGRSTPAGKGPNFACFDGGVQARFRLYTEGARLPNKTAVEGRQEGQVWQTGMCMSQERKACHQLYQACPLQVVPALCLLLCELTGMACLSRHVNSSVSRTCLLVYYLVCFQNISLLLSVVLLRCAKHCFGNQTSPPASAYCTECGKL